ncbi:hypothetical protein OS493_009884 [Desmophyllum pertusum]|uniref:Uncharacterized protein n=1 Tax=Desmophyllum pertusum TaxID=174260 RepID=A0A9W9YEC5_9CNID|nr:hypothetical protein OS493_009884 [Desmophyllum pertusum]
MVTPLVRSGCFGPGWLVSHNTIEIPNETGRNAEENKKFASNNRKHYLTVNNGIQITAVGDTGHEEKPYQDCSPFFIIKKGEVNFVSKK